MMRALVGLGGNLGGLAAVAVRFDDAVRAMHSAFASAELARSPLYQSAPVGPVAEQPAFLNAVVLLTFADEAPSPRALLVALRAIETAAGRQREGPAGGPRVLDLDLLLVGAQSLVSAELTLPHPRLAERAFVLRPMADLLGLDFELPDAVAGGASLRSLLAKPHIAAQDIRPWAPT